MSWTIARMGSRFNLLFEPYRRRVMHSAMGRFLDQPLDLMVGLEEPDGTRRVLPFTTEGVCLANPEQFERVNSITYRGYSEKYNLRFEFNVHSVFYPQDERLCVMPAFYLEMRVNPVERVRWNRAAGPTPSRVKLFIRLRRPETRITVQAGTLAGAVAIAGASAGTVPRPEGGAGVKREAWEQPASIDLAYRNTLTPRLDPAPGDFEKGGGANSGGGPTVEVRERILSLNAECMPLEEGDGLACELPVTEAGSGVKWRLVWAAHVAEPVLKVDDGQGVRDAAFRYTEHWPDLEAVIDEAVRTRDDRLAHSRRFEKLLDQAPLDVAERHLMQQSFQAWLSNTFWCRLAPDDHQATPQGEDARPSEWFSVWEGSCFYHSTLGVEYNASLVYFALWPRLLGVQLQQWARHAHPHPGSDGAYLSHDLGEGPAATGQAAARPGELEANCDYLLLLQAYTHWTGDKSLAQAQPALLERLARYLLWTDRDGSGFPTEGVPASTLPEAATGAGLASAFSHAFSQKQTSLAVMRICALRGAASLLTMAGREELARQCEDTADADLKKVERAAWLGDHYAVAIDPSASGVLDAWSGKPLPHERMPGWDAYSIHTGSAMLLPTIIGLPPALDQARLRKDMINAARESLSRYGCGDTSTANEEVVVSQNLWRDLLARYLNIPAGLSAQHYWDMQVMSNTDQQSLGYVDTYVSDNLCFYPRGITSIGYFLAGPRLIVDRLAAGGLYITVDPDRHIPQRWPLLPLADWRAGKIPVCVVDEQGRVTIEGKIDPVIIHGSDPTATPSNAGLIG